MRTLEQHQTEQVNGGAFINVPWRGKPLPPLPVCPPERAPVPPSEFPITPIPWPIGEVVTE